MAQPSVPTGFMLQQGNSTTYSSWNIMPGATSYDVQRSTDGVTFVIIASPVTPYYLDSTVVVGTLYYYRVRATDGFTPSNYSNILSTVPTLQGTMSLGQIRLLAQQKADMQNSNFVSTTEWNQYINQSAFELYDLLVTLYEDFYMAPPFTFNTDGINRQYDLSVLLPTFYKLLGADCGLATNNNARFTLHKFEFIKRNRSVFPNITGTLLGVFDIGYRLMGSTLMFEVIPSAGQPITLWWVPRMKELLADNDILDGVSGWIEYVIIDAAIKARQKEETDVTVLMSQKLALKQRIEETATNKDAGQPDCISDTRRANSRGWGSSGGDFGWY